MPKSIQLSERHVRVIRQCQDQISRTGKVAVRVGNTTAILDCPENKVLGEIKRLMQEYSADDVRLAAPDVSVTYTKA